MMHCISIDDDYLLCNDCKGCEGLTCNNCEFFDLKTGCCLSKCNFKYSDISKNAMKVAKQISWR